MAVDDVGGEDQRDLEARFLDRRRLHDPRHARAIAVEHAGELALPRLLDLLRESSTVACGGLSAERGAAAPGRRHQAELPGFLLERHARDQLVDECRDMELCRPPGGARAPGLRARRPRRRRPSARPGAKSRVSSIASPPPATTCSATAELSRGNLSCLTPCVTGYMDAAAKAFAIAASRDFDVAVAADREVMAEATIRDVARRAQVSVASVSRVLNRLDNVSEQTRERVTDAVDELGYVPHAGARSLSLARTEAIGVVLPDLHGEFFSEIVRGMDREASRARLSPAPVQHARARRRGRNRAARRCAGESTA